MHSFITSISSLPAFVRTCATSSDRVVFVSMCFILRPTVCPILSAGSATDLWLPRWIQNNLRIVDVLEARSYCFSLSTMTMSLMTIYRHTVKTFREIGFTCLMSFSTRTLTGGWGQSYISCTYWVRIFWAVPCVPSDVIASFSCSS